MTQPHDLVGQTPSGCGLLGVVERDETGVMCHECGRWLGGLSWHITKTHQMTVADYRQRHELPATVPLVSLGTSALISANSRERVGTPAWQRFELRATGIPLGTDAERGRKWINQPPRAEA